MVLEMSGMLTKLDVAREKRDSKEYKRERGDGNIWSEERGEEEETSCDPLHQGLRRTEKNLALIQSTDVLEDLKYSTTVVGIPKRSSGEGQSGWPSEVYKISCDECEARYIGETEWPLMARFGEHRSPSSITSDIVCGAQMVWKGSEWSNLHPGLETFIKQREQTIQPAPSLE